MEQKSINNQQKNEYKLSTLYAICLVMMFAVEIAFGHSTGLYTVLMTGSILVTTWMFLRSTSRIPPFCIFVCAYCFIVPFLVSLSGNDIQDVPMTMVSLLLPFVLSSKPINTDNVEKTCWVVSVAMILLNSFKSIIPVLRDMNINSYTFLIYMGLAAALILLHYKKSIWTILLNFYAVFITMNAGSRNAFIVAVLIFVVSLLPYPVLSRPLVYRLIYALSLSYQIFSLSFLEYVETNSFLTGIFENYVQPYFNKSWGIESRVNLYSGVAEEIWKQDIVKLLFGNGRAFFHAHNGFYQMIFIYGLIGTIFILAMYAYIFEMGLKVVRKKHNHLVMGCVIAMCSLFLMQGADVFLLGVKSCKFVPFLLVGIILSEYYRLHEEEKAQKDEEIEAFKDQIRKNNAIKSESS